MYLGLCSNVYRKLLRNAPHSAAQGSGAGVQPSLLFRRSEGTLLMVEWPSDTKVATTAILRSLNELQSGGGAVREFHFNAAAATHSSEVGKNLSPFHKPLLQ